MIGEAVVAAFMKSCIYAQKVAMLALGIAQLHAPLKFDDLNIQCATKVVYGRVTAIELGQVRVNPCLNMHDSESDKILHKRAELRIPFGVQFVMSTVKTWPEMEYLL